MYESNSVQCPVHSVLCIQSITVHSAQLIPLEGHCLLVLAIYRVTSHGVPAGRAVNGDYRGGISREIRKYGNNLRPRKYIIVRSVAEIRKYGPIYIAMARDEN